MADIEADVIIVGSGISGALMGAKLSAVGVKVAILEAGSGSSAFLGRFDQGAGMCVSDERGGRSSG